jgi:NADH-quinone oxidoreductase subunit K
MILIQILINIILFIIGFIGVIFNYTNILMILIGVELMLLSCNLNFIIFSLYLNDIEGMLFSIFILTVAAAEASIGLAILIVLYQVKQSVKMENSSICKG